MLNLLDIDAINDPESFGCGNNILIISSQYKLLQQIQLQDKRLATKLRQVSVPCLALLFLCFRFKLSN